MESLELSIKGTEIQWLGTALVALLLWLQLRSMRRAFLVYWSVAWTALTAALGGLVLAFLVPPLALPGQAIYCFGEYAYGFLLVAGCRHLVTGTALTGRHLWALAPMTGVAIGLPVLAKGDFNSLMVGHATVMAGFFAAAFVVTLHGRRGRARGGGLVAMLIFLALLTADFAQYPPLCAACLATQNRDLFPHLRYSSLYDMTLEVLLAFSMTMVVSDFMRRELEAANQELLAVGRRFRSLAERDPLTDALNRHAFEALKQERRAAGPADFAGCVVMFDVDDLKPINDTCGHAAGDVAIQAVARTVRGLIRGDDFLFRWGGDEFLLIWHIKESEAVVRLERLPGLLAVQVHQAALALPGELTVSWGVCSFAGFAGLDAAVQAADQRMYRQKGSRKAGKAAAAG